jgi:chromosome segregation ATPase
MKTDFLDFKKGYIEMEASHSKLSNEVKQLRKVENERQSIQKEFQWTSELLDKSNQELIKVKKELKHYQNQNESTIDYKKEIGTLHKKVQKQKLDLEQKEKELSLLNSKYQQKIKDEKAIYESLAKFESSTINQQKSSITQRANQQLLINKNKIDELNSKIESLIKQNHDLLSKNQMLEVQVEEQKKISSQFA